MMLLGLQSHKILFLRYCEKEFYNFKPNNIICDIHVFEWR